MIDDANLPTPQGQFLIYADGATQLQVRLEGNTVWLTQKLIAKLYGVSVKTVNDHLVNILSEAWAWIQHFIQRRAAGGGDPNSIPEGRI